MINALRSLLKQAFWQRAISVLIVVLGFNVVSSLDVFRQNLPFIHKWQLVFHRLLCAITPRPISAKWVRVVEIDDALHRELGEPTDRNFLAALVTNATQGNAAAVVLDFKLIAPAPVQNTHQRTDADAHLLQAIQNAADEGVPVVVPCWLKNADKGRFVRHANIYLDSELPLPDATGVCMRAACAVLGNVNLPVDERLIPLVTEMENDDPCQQSLALSATTAYENSIDRQPRTVEKAIVHHALKDHEFVFGSFIKEDDFQRISAKDLSQKNAQALRACRGRIVLIGGKWHSDMGNGEFVDRHNTPVGDMQGLYLHANYIEGLLDDRDQLEVPLWFGLLFDLVIGGALYYFFHKADKTADKLIVMGLFFIPLFASYIVFANLNRYLDFVLPLLGCFVHLTVEMVREYLKLRKEKPA
jgi:CHASE2 domain-containing sensor protein